MNGLDFTEIIVENWGTIAVISVAIVGATRWIYTIYQIKKLRLEIADLKAESQNKKKSQIEIATIEEIERYVSQTKDKQKIRQFIQNKLSELEATCNNSNDSIKVTSTEIAIILHNYEGSPIVNVSLFSSFAGSIAYYAAYLKYGLSGGVTPILFLLVFNIIGLVTLHMYQFYKSKK